MSRMTRSFHRLPGSLRSWIPHEIDRCGPKMAPMGHTDVTALLTTLYDSYATGDPSPG